MLLNELRLCKRSKEEDDLKRLFLIEPFINDGIIAEAKACV